MGDLGNMADEKARAVRPELIADIKSKTTKWTPMEFHENPFANMTNEQLRKSLGSLGIGEMKAQMSTRKERKNEESADVWSFFKNMFHKLMVGSVKAGEPGLSILNQTIANDTNATASNITGTFANVSIDSNGTNSTNFTLPSDYKWIFKLDTISDA